MHRVSRLFIPPNEMSKKTKNIAKAKNTNLLIELGLMKPLNNGTFYYLPVLQRSLNKTSQLIKRFMNKVNAHEITIPSLTSVELWRNSGRFERFQSELFMTKDRYDRSLLLGPTFEEAITNMMTIGHEVAEKQLPLRFYQIGNKFRDEMSPRHGLLRSREFIMKDMYTFDVDKSNAMKSYEEISDIYAKLFKYIGIPYAKVEADAKAMGGHLSHEYHYFAPIGDENILICRTCGHSTKTDDDNGLNQCSNCSGSDFEQNNGIEIGHTFYLGDTFSRKLKANYMKAGKPAPMEMGCYGIGVTRLIGAAIESLSTETHIRWPFSLAPYSVCIITPEKRSKAFTIASHYLEEIYNRLDEVNELKDSILVDDRIKITIGDRFRWAKRFGVPLIVIIGQKACDADNAQFELHFTNDNKTVFLPLNEIVSEIAQFAMMNSNEN